MTVIRVVVAIMVSMVIMTVVAVVRVAIMVGMVIMTVVCMIVVAVVVMTVMPMIVVAVASVTMVVASELNYQCFALCEQVALLVGDFLFHLRNLALNLFQCLRDAVGSHNAQGVHGRNEVVVGQPKFTIVSGVTSCPVKLL